MAVVVSDSSSSQIVPIPGRPKVALLLCGAGSKGAAQIGMLQAFLDLGWQYDLLFGSSAGALNAAMLHQGSADKLKELWMGIKSKDVYRWSPLNALDPLSKGSIYDSRPLKRLIEKWVRPEDLYFKKSKFFILATNFSTWQPFQAEVSTLQPEEIVDLLYASSSPPVFFPVVPFRNQLLADSGIVSNYNISKAVEEGAEVLVVMGFPCPEPYPPKTVKDSLSQAMGIAMQGYFWDELGFVEFVNQWVDRAPELKKIKVITIVPPKSLGIDLLDFDLKGRNREELWQYGYNLSREALESSGLRPEGLNVH